MDLLEYEGKDIFRRHGIPVPVGRVVRTPQEALEAATDVGLPVMVKAQMRKGGRGNAGLIRKAQDAATAGTMAADILGTVRLESEVQVEAVLIEQQVEVAHELYLAIRVDDVAGAPVVVASTAGGVEVETGAGKVAMLTVKILEGLARHQAVALWKEAGLSGRALRGAADVTVSLWQAFRASDADLMEVNPLIVDTADRFWAADARVVISDNAAYRQPLVAENWLSVAATPMERRARALGVNSFLELGGEVVLYCSGAGFSMLTFDAISQAGIRPANFLDMGGATNKVVREKTAELVLSLAEQNPNVKVILLAMVLTMQPLENTVDAMAAAMKRRPPRVPVVAWVHAGFASTRNMSIVEARQRLEEIGVRTARTLDETIAAVVEVAKA